MTMAGAVDVARGHERGGAALRGIAAGRQGRILGGLEAWIWSVASRARGFPPRPIDAWKSLPGKARGKDRGHV